MKNLSVCLIGILFLFFSCTQKKSFQREYTFNNNWKFIRADVENAQLAAFDDSEWRTLDLPHDYSIEDLREKEDVKQIGPFSEESAGGSSTGHVVGETAWYRKHFTLDKKDEGKRIKILFDGVYMNADFWINGKHLGNHPYGYTAFHFDLTDYLNPVGEENVLAVQVKNEGKNSRWYSGSGIYRNVTLLKVSPVYVDVWGTYVTSSEVSKEKATLKIETRVANSDATIHDIKAKLKILNSEGEAVKESELDVNLSETNIIQAEEELENPDLWSPENPKLYTLVVQLWEGNKLLDEAAENFGVRSIEFSPEKGFLLNGKSVFLKGGCLHHDNGPLGAAAFETAEYRRVKTMKENGFNAIRTAHNPPSKLFLDACDELGVLVMDESFDQWQRPKNPQDYSQYFDDWWEKDLESMVLRDRNHPSIIIWSIGNEINERADSSGLEIAQNLREKVLSMDSSRPVTQAICHFWDHPGREWSETAAAFAQLDVHGYNYRWADYESDHKQYPERIIIGTESFPKQAFENWEMVEKHPYVIGDFVWTGMDYFGESGIGHSKLDTDDFGFLPPWPWFNGYCGDISVTGFKKPQMYYRDVVWRNSELEMLVHAPVPEGRTEIISKWGWPNEWKSWNWEDSEDKPLTVSVYSRCDQVRLELNGKVIGTKNILQEITNEMQTNEPSKSAGSAALTAYFEVPYQPGELIAIGLNDGQEVVRQSLKTAGNASVLQISSETVKDNTDDLIYFNVEVLDDNGNLVPNADIPVEFEITGEGKLQAVANGNPSDMKSFQQAKVNTFRGRCQLIVLPKKESGEIVVSVKSEGLRSGECKVL